MNLPENVVLEIMLRLSVHSVRSVIRFRCVCKMWCAVIKSCLFKDKHLALKHARGVGDDVIVFQRLLKGGYPDVIYRSFVNCNDYESLAISISAAASSNDFEITGKFPMVKVINHVKGILCIVGGEQGNYCNVTLLNPTIREFRTLPVPDLGFKWYTQGFGLGFDDATNEYKVVGIVTVIEQGCYDNKHIVLVYRLSTNSWNILGEIPAFLSEDSKSIICNRPYLLARNRGGYAFCPWSCTFSHGSLHWLRGGVKLILTFNMTTESFQEIHFPQAWEDYGSEIVHQLFTADGGSTITLVAYTDLLEFEGTTTLLDVWVMKEYGVAESWTKQYSVTPFPVDISSVSCFWRKDKLLLETSEHKLICYDLSKDELYQPYLSSAIVGTCIESFVSVQGLRNASCSLPDKDRYEKCRLADSSMMN